MKYLLALAMLIASPAWADWVEVGEIGGNKSYIDPSTIRIDGNFRKVWTMDNYPMSRSVNGVNVWSLRSRFEYDCKEERLRLLSVSSFSKPYATGESLNQYDSPTEWRDIPPNTIGTVIFNRVCAQSPTGK